jgi:PTH2 family peptidyl-tRNA hydrolase
MADRAIIAGISGYMIGIASSLGFFPIPFMPKIPKARGIANYDDEEESEEEDIDESILDHAPNWTNGLEADKRDGLRATAAGSSTAKETRTKQEWEDSTLNEECKLVLVVRTDLGMTKGMYLSPPTTIRAKHEKAKLLHNAGTRL